MKLIVTDETYKDFSCEYPNLSKGDLERILKHSKQFSEYDYWNHFETSELPPSIYNDDFLLKAIVREKYSFFVHEDDQRTYELPAVIDLKPDSDYVIFWTHE